VINNEAHVKACHSNLLPHHTMKIHGHCHSF
jgi:hypothetical protein